MLSTTAAVPFLTLSRLTYHRVRYSRAALSTLLAENERKRDALLVLEDGQYDTGDDASEFSLDGHETTSIASE